MSEKFALLRRAQEELKSRQAARQKALDDDAQRSFIETARRAQIVDCAIDAIAELGYARASLAQIAKRANVSAGVIFYYFGTRDELLRAVIVSIATFLNEFVLGRADLTTATTALRTTIEASVLATAANPKKMTAVHYLYVGSLTADGPAFDPALTEPRRKGFAAILEEGQKTGEFRSFEISSMIYAVTAAIDSVPRQWTQNPNIDLVRYAKDLVDLFERAVRNDN